MNITDIIESELAPIREKYGKEAVWMYLDGFILRLPDKRFARNGCLRYGLTDNQWKSKWREIEYCTDKNSEIFKNQTPQEFYEKTIDKVLVDVGISIDKICKLQKENKKIELFNLVLPAFIKLREMGYNEADLGYTAAI